MELKKLNKSVLKLWYIYAAIAAFAILLTFTIIAITLNVAGAPGDVTVATLLGIGIPAFVIIGIILIMPALRYKMYAWGYDDKRITVKQGVIFRQRVVIPVCQIQDHHRTQGPIMMILKLSGVIISTAGSNFSISTLTTEEADRIIDDLGGKLESRIEELKNEEV
ncbi:MAG: PH domain-containing protein [Clostridia bacterium]|nr:PH domain-containing protein [Clostridia bacterium]